MKNSVRTNMVVDGKLPLFSVVHEYLGIRSASKVKSDRFFMRLHRSLQKVWDQSVGKNTIDFAWEYANLSIPISTK